MGYSTWNKGYFGVRTELDVVLGIVAGAIAGVVIIGAGGVVIAGVITG